MDSTSPWPPPVVKKWKKNANVFQQNVDLKEKVHSKKSAFSILKVAMAKMPCPWGPLRTSKYRSCQSTGPDILSVRNRQASRNTSCLVTLPLPSFQNPAAKVPVFSKGSLEIIIGSAATKDMSLTDPNTKSTTNDHQKTNTHVITARRLFRCCWWKGAPKAGDFLLLPGA